MLPPRYPYIQQNVQKWNHCMAGQTEDKRFAKPWTVEEVGECFRIMSANSIAVAYVYFEDEKSRADQMGHMNRRQALQIANRIAMIGAE